MKKRYISTLFIVSSLLFTSACNKKEDTPSIEIEKEVSITLDQKNVSLYVDETVQLVSIVENYSGTVTWQSSDPLIASVDASGLVSAKGKGKCVVMARAGDKQAVANIEVKENTYEFSLNSEDILLNKNKTFTIKPTLIYRDQAKNDVTFNYVSSNEEVATVDNSGLVTAVGYGEAEITVSVKVGNDTYSIVALVKVQSGETISLENKNVNLYKKNEAGFAGSIQLTPVVKDADNEDIINPELTWDSENDEIATVSDNGLVTAVGVGSTTVSAIYMSEDGCQKACYANINVDLLSKSLTNTYTIELLNGETSSLSLPGLSSASEVKVNDEVVDSNLYTIESGSLVINNSVFSSLNFAEEIPFSVDGDYRYTGKVVIYSKFINTKADLYTALKANAKAVKENNYFKGYFVLNNDIDCGDDTFIKYTTDDVPAGQVACLTDANTQNNQNGFRGIFDGQGHKISNFKLSCGHNGIFGEIGQDGLVKNTIFEYSPNAKFTGNGGIITYNIMGGGIVQDCLVSLSEMSDVNSASLFATNCLGMFKNNLAIYKGTGEMENAYLFVKNGPASSLSHCYCVTSANFTHYIGNHEKTDSSLFGTYADFLTLLADQKVKLPALEKQGVYLKWCDTTFDFIGEDVDHTIYLEKPASVTTTVKVPFLAQETVESINIEGKEIEFTQSGEDITFAANQFTSLNLGSNKINYLTENKLYSAEAIICSDIITSKDELLNMFRANAIAHNSTSAFSGYYVLGNSIDLDGTALKEYSGGSTNDYCLPTKTGVAWSGGFEGTFDGCGYAISNFTLPFVSRTCSLFGGVTQNGKVINTVFRYQAGATFNGYGGLVADSASGLISHNMVVVDAIRDYAANSMFGYNIVQSSGKCIFENVVYYTGSVNLSSTKLICRDGRSDGKAKIEYNVAITSTTTGLINSSYTYENNAKVADLAALQAQGSVSGYSFINDYLTLKGENYYWGNALIK